MIKNQLLYKTIKQYFKTFAVQNHFQIKKSRILLRECRDTLHIICFEAPTPGFHCTIAIQPLYVPGNFIALGFGSRINHFKERMSGSWGYGDTVQELEQDLAVVKGLLEKNALPWFQEVGNPEGIISFIRSGQSANIKTMVSFPEIYRNLYLGFSYLYLGEYSRAEKPLRKLIEENKKDGRGWVVEIIQMVEYLLYTAKNEPEKVSGILEGYIQQTKSNLKI